MKKTLLTAVAVVMMTTATAQKLAYLDSLDAMILAVGCVESRNNPKAIGDNGHSFGFLQISQPMVDEANRLARMNLFCLSECKDSMTSVMLFTHVLAFRLNGELNPERVAHLWNPQSGKKYREAIKQRFNYYLYILGKYGRAHITAE